MEQPGRLEENLVNLSNIMDDLKKFRDEVAPKKAQQMASWLENVNKKLQEFHALEKQIKELNKGGGWRIRCRLNREVLDLGKTANLLKELGHELSNTVEALFIDLMEGKPKRFSYANLISYTSNFSMGFHPARHGRVYIGQFPNGDQVNVKILDKFYASKALKDMYKELVEAIFMSEINTMFKTSHRNLIKLHGFCFEKNKKGLVFEYMSNGSFDEVLFGNHHESIEWEKLYNIAIETGKGLSYLHDGCDEQLIHRDLSTASVHLDSSYSAKITNFGMMKLVSRLKDTFQMSRRGNLSYYAAPELFRRRSNVTYKCDVYSFGVILFEILGRCRIEENVPTHLELHDYWRMAEKEVYWNRFEGRKVDVYWKWFEEGKVEELLKEWCIPDKNRKEAKILCMVAFWCIQFTPDNRPSMSTVVKMLEKEIQVVSPPNPFMAATSPMKSYKEVVYEERWFMKIKINHSANIICFLINVFFFNVCLNMYALRGMKS